MKLKNFLTIFALTSGLAVGALFAGKSATAESKEARATTDIGEVTISEVRNAISTNTAMYLLPTQNYALPDSWDNPYVGASEKDGVFLNGIKIEGAALKYAGTGSAFITFYYGLPRAAVEGDVVEFKGTFTCAAADKSFTMNYATQRFAETWVHALEDYDIVSLEDANMPNFENVALNTDDAFGGAGAYVTDSAALPKQKGFFGLTNDTGSYAFQFNYQKSSTGTGWFHVLIGASGTLWSTGHFIDFGFLDAWADTGHSQIKEMRGKGNNWEAETLHETGAIALGWNVGEVNLLEMGLIKVKGSSQRFIFFKVNGTLKFSEYWTLADGGMTTKVTLQYGGTDAKVTNSITPESTKLSVGSYVVGSKQIYLNMAKDLCPAVVNWSDYFKSVDGEGLKLNDSAIGVSNWNYFKKTGSTQMFLALGDLGVTPVSGDILYVGGMFKAAREVDGVKTLFKVNFAPTYFQYLGDENWAVINPNYEASDFSKDLLKMTLTICTGAGGNNHDALATVWAVLADADHYGALAMDELETLSEAVGSGAIVVPSTEAGVEDMLPEDAIAAAMYRYDYCTSKYSLSNFIVGRPAASNNASIIGVITKMSSNDMLQIIIAISSVVLVAAIAIPYFVMKRKEK